MIRTFFFALCLGAALSGSSQKMRVNIEGIVEPSGFIVVYLFNNETDFDKNAPFRNSNIGVNTDTAACMFDNIKEGCYAIRAYQDMNNNGRLDKSKFGIPTEMYGYSSNPKTMMRMPNFIECEVDIYCDTTIYINLR